MTKPPNLTKIGEIEQLIDTDQLLADIATLEADNKWGEVRERRRLLTVIEKRRRPKRRRLVEFIRLVQRYQRMGIVRVGTEKAKPESFLTERKLGTGRASNRSLSRKPDTTQNKIANILLAGFKPGETFQLEMAVDRVRHLVPPGSKPGQWVGTYLTREMNYINGILETVGPKVYKMRPDAKKYLENTE